MRERETGEGVAAPYPQAMVSGPGLTSASWRTRRLRPGVAAGGRGEGVLGLLKMVKVELMILGGVLVTLERVGSGGRVEVVIEEEMVIGWRIWEF